MTPLRRTHEWFGISLNSDVPSCFRFKTFMLQRYNRLPVKLQSQGSSANGNLPNVERLNEGAEKYRSKTDS
jgi:hypothetical protein